ncbi:MAG: hypothetical protein VW709_20290 [Rickettsiales bacterium]|jgi:hypothetical protein
MPTFARFVVIDAIIAKIPVLANYIEIDQKALIPVSIYQTRKTPIKCGTVISINSHTPEYANGGLLVNRSKI